MEIKIGSVVTTTEELMAAWDKRNNSGNGYATESDDMHKSRLEFSEVVSIDPTGNFVGLDGENIVVVCDSNGPWACDVTRLIKA